jgi:hypothetical protein
MTSNVFSNFYGRKRTLGYRNLISLSSRQPELLRDDVDILWLDTGEDLISFMEVCAGFAVVGKKRTELEISLNDQGEFVNGAFKNFHGDLAGKGIDTSGINSMEADFFWSQRKEQFCRRMSFLSADI